MRRLRCDVRFDSDVSDQKFYLNNYNLFLHNGISVYLLNIMSGLKKELFYQRLVY